MSTNYSRRSFLSTSLLAGIALSIPDAARAAAESLRTTTRIGLITDLHQDIMHDGAQRLYSFIASMKKQAPDALFQLGDFAYPAEKNKGVIDAFRNAHEHSYHVIGNHDTDSGHTKEQCLQVWGMPARYYSTDVKGIRFIVLDGNDKGSPTHKGGYPAFINKEQCDWLEEELKKASQPVIIVSHQPLAGPMAVDNSKEVQAILSRFKNRVILSINGHTHIDGVYYEDGIPYVHINSASYFWVGGDFKHESYDTDIHLQYPWIASTCPYESALYTLLSIDPKNGQIRIDGKKSRWKGPSPAELGFSKKYGYDLGDAISPTISKRKFKPGTV
jgi:predicted phosphodiesterase